jgi:hypothetical protein
MLGIAAACVIGAGLLAGCGGDDEPAADGTASTATAAESAPGGDSADRGSASGSMTLDGEAITFTSVRCVLEPQEAAAGGGQILFVGQGEGATSSGEELLLDVSRYDEGSMFAGDSVSLTVGPAASPDSVTYELGGADAVTLSGSTMSATDISLDDPAAGVSRQVSFELSC